MRTSTAPRRERRPAWPIVAAVLGAFVAGCAPAQTDGLDEGGVPGRAYYVSASAPARTAECGLDAPCATIDAGLAKLRPGDTLFLRGGTYAETLSWTESAGPRGTDEAHRVTIRAYPGEVATLMPKTGAERANAVVQIRCAARGVPLELSGPCQYGRCSSACPQYVTLGSPPGDGAKIVIDARETSGPLAGGIWFQPGSGLAASSTTGAHHMRFVGVEVKNSPSHGIFVGAGDYNEFIDLDVHDNGAGGSIQLHGVYVCSKRNRFVRGKFHHNRDAAFLVYNGGNGAEASFNVIDGAEVYGNGCTAERAGGNHCSLDDAPAVSSGTGRRNVFTNMYVHDNANTGFWFEAGSFHNEVTNNVVTANATRSGWANGGIYLGAENYASEVVDGEQFDPALQELEYLPWTVGGVAVGTLYTTVRRNTLRGNRGGDICAQQIKSSDAHADLKENACSR